MNNKNLELKKHSAAIQISQTISAQQRKCYNALLLLAKKRLITHGNSKFQTNLATIKGITGYTSDDDVTFKALLKQLTTITVEYNLLGKDTDNSWGAFALLAGVTIQNGKVEYSFPHQINDILLNPKMYSILDLNIIHKLDSKYAIAFYELGRDYINVEIPKMHITQFRELMGIDSVKYKNFAHLREKVLDKGIDEVLEKTELKITYNLYKKGRKVTHIKFHTEKQQIPIFPIDIPVKNMEADDLLNLVPEQHRRKKTVINAIRQAFKSHNKTYVERNITYTNEKAGRSYAGFFVPCLKQDWAHDWWIDKQHEIKTTEEAERKRKDPVVIESQIRAQWRNMGDISRMVFEKAAGGDVELAYKQYVENEKQRLGFV